MLLTIVTVCYNSSKTIAETLQSIDLFINGHSSIIEHLIIDGCSTDDTLSIADSFSRPWRKVISSPDRGIYDAMNKGLGYAAGTYVWFVNAYDILHPDILNNKSDFISQLAPATYDIVLGSIVLFKEDKNHIVRLWSVRNINIPRELRYGWTPSHPGSILKKSLINKLNGFNLRYPIAADLDLLLRSIKITDLTKIHTSNLTFILFRLGGHSNGSFRKILKGNAEYYKIRRALGSTTIESLLLSILKLLRKILQVITTKMKTPKRTN